MCIVDIHSGSITPISCYEIFNKFSHLYFGSLSNRNILVETTNCFSTLSGYLMKKINMQELVSFNLFQWILMRFYILLIYRANNKVNIDKNKPKPLVINFSNFVRLK